MISGLQQATDHLDLTSNFIEGMVDFAVSEAERLHILFGLTVDLVYHPLKANDKVFAKKYIKLG